MSKRLVTSVSAATVLAALASIPGLAACSGGGSSRVLSPAGQRGESTFAAFCASCHNYGDPFKDGAQGPAIARSSRELLVNKVLHARYPDGYQPKRPGAITMPPVVAVKDRIDDLYAFLQEVPEPSTAPAK